MRGRKPRRGVPTDKRIHICVTADERAELQKVAQDHRASVSAIVRDAVNEFVADYRERLVFIGSKGSPP